MSSVLFVAVASCSGGGKPPPPAETTALDSGGGGTSDATMPSVPEDASQMTAPVDADQTVDASMGASIDAAPDVTQMMQATCVSTDPDATDVLPMMCLGKCVNIDTDSKNCGGCSQPCNLPGEICDFGVCRCPDPQIVCSGQCVDITQDPTNCGSCGHNCQGNPCNMGNCQASAIAQVTTPTEFLASIAVDDTSLYWTQGVNAQTSAGIYVKPFAGSSATIALLGASDDPRGIVVGHNDLYWVDYADGTLNQKPLLGGNPVALVAPGDGGSNGPLAVTLDAKNNVYWVGSTDGTVNQLSADDPTFTVHVLLSGQNSPVAVAVDTTNIYWIDYGSQGNPGSVNKAPLVAPHTVTHLAPSEDSPWGLAIDATHVYWTNRVNSTGTIKSVPIAGGTIVTIAQNQGAPYGIAVDSQYVYWTNYDNNTVMKAPLAGGTIYMLASGQSNAEVSNPSALAVDAVNVYWANYGSGYIMKVAK